MEFNSGVLLYSKYSATSKKLMDYIKTSGVDFTNLIGLQHLCVDNEQVRKRITNNSQIAISSVPCILLIYKDGGIEKYEGSSVFNWCEDVIKQFTQPPQNIPVDQRLNRNTVQQEQQISMTDNQYNINKYEEHVEDPIVIEKRRRAIENTKLFEENKRKYEEQQSKESMYSSTPEKEFNRLPISGSSSSDGRSSKQFTSLEDLPSEDEEPDRYKNRKPVGRIRTNDGNYEGGEQLFQGPTIRKPINKNALKNDNNKTQQKSSDIMNKAKELAKGREPPPVPPGHPGISL
jgi:hypothetical protein